MPLIKTSNIALFLLAGLFFLPGTKAEHVTDNLRVPVVPRVVTNCPPDAVVHDLHSSLAPGQATHQPYGHRGRVRVGICNATYSDSASFYRISYLP